MNRSTLKNPVVSGIVCLSLAVVGVLQSGNGAPVVHDGNAPSTPVATTQHLDDMKLSNPILDKQDELSSLEL